MPRQLPTPTANMIADLRQIGRYLDHVADTAISDRAHANARALAIRCWQAIETVEGLADVVEDLAQHFGDPTFNPYEQGRRQ